MCFLVFMGIMIVVGLIWLPFSNRYEREDY
jgi:hypothetical protein